MKNPNPTCTSIRYKLQTAFNRSFWVTEDEEFIFVQFIDQKVSVRKSGRRELAIMNRLVQQIWKRILRCEDVQ